jgi:hypothetical protein
MIKEVKTEAISSPCLVTGYIFQQSRPRSPTQNIRPAIDCSSRPPSTQRHFFFLNELFRPHRALSFFARLFQARDYSVRSLAPLFRAFGTEPPRRLEEALTARCSPLDRNRIKWMEWNCAQVSHFPIYQCGKW